MKIVFLGGAIVFWFVVLFPYDDLSDYVTYKTTQMTQSQVYLQSDGLSFALMPQPGIQMENVFVETVLAPAFEVDTLGLAPGFGLLFGKPSALLKAAGFFGGDASVDVNPSNELDTQGLELGFDVILQKVALKKLSKFLQKQGNFPLTISGQTDLDSNLFFDTSYKKQPKGEIDLKIQDLDIPSSNIGLPMGGGAMMSMSFPALKLSALELEGNIREGILNIKKGKVGDPKNDLHGTVTGDLFFDVQRGGKVKMGGYDIRLNLNISESLKRQLETVLGFVDIYNGIGDKYKFDSLRGVRYSMRLKARNLQTPPQVLSN
jgi:type II secretion system protein N